MKVKSISFKSSKTLSACGINAVCFGDNSTYPSPKSLNGQVLVYHIKITKCSTKTLVTQFFLSQFTGRIFVPQVLVVFKIGFMEFIEQGIYSTRPVP
jgi:hypothetical protein